MSDRVGVMDLGTNTFHLLIAEVNKSDFKILHRERQPVKIGKGGINQGHLQPEAVKRALDCLQSFRERMDVMGVKRHRAFGTSALRSAHNGVEVIESIKTRTGIVVDLITGEQEAEFIYHGIGAALDLGEPPSLLVDIGGGSVEFIIANRKQIFWKASVNIGAQRLLELYHRTDPMTKEELNRLDNHYEQSLKPLFEAAQQLKPEILVGSSGTFDTLSEIHCSVRGIPYSPDEPETPLTLEAFQQIHQQFISKDRAARMLIPGMIEMRVDMIVVASCLIHFLVERLDFKRIRVSSWSLKEGAIARWAAEGNF